MGILAPHYSEGEIIRLSTDKYVNEKLPQSSPGKIIHVRGNRSGTFIYEVEVVTQEKDFPRVTKMFQEEELEKLETNGTGAVRKEDWRKERQGISVSEDALLPGTDQIARKGSQVDLVSKIQLAPNKTIDVVEPNGTAILLSTSRKAWQQAQRIQAENNIDETRSFSSKSNSIEYQENVVMAIITAFTSVEIFSNEMIPEDSYFEDKETKIKVRKNKTQIEKMPVSKKLAEVLPKMLDTISPKEREPFWSKFEKLRNVRNRIIHMKNADRMESTPDNPNIWHKIFSIECPHQTALQIMDFFFDQTGSRPRWRENGPFEDDES